MASLAQDIQHTLRDIPDFPKEGILFKDITPVLQDGALFGRITSYWVERFASERIDAIVGIESRGFIFGAALAQAMGLGLVLVRKPGKLPGTTIGIDYALEYGSDRLEVHDDALKQGDRVVILDDLLATGGTASACVELMKELGAEVVECGFIIELDFLEGCERVGAPTHSIVHI